MKNLLYLLLVVIASTLGCVTLEAQMTTRPGMQFAVQSSTGSGPKFTVLGITSDELSKYNATDVVVGDKVYVLDGSECYELTVDSILTAAGAILEARLHDSTGVLTTVTTGQGAIVSPYTTRNVPFIPSGLRSDLASCILQKIASTVNSVTGSSGVDNCTKTVTQTAHGFGDGDVLYWDEAESEYVTFTGNYADASWPVYIVLDSLTANTFTGVSCGIIDEDFSLPEGLYYATNTGLSLTPAAVEYPVLKVYDGKAQVLAFPGLEFDATGKELFDVVTPTGQRTVNGGDVLDLHADSTRVNITIADTAATDVGHALELLKNNSGSEVTGIPTRIPYFGADSTLKDTSVLSFSTAGILSSPQVTASQYNLLGSGYMVLNGRYFRNDGNSFTFSDASFNVYHAFRTNGNGTSIIDKLNIGSAGFADEALHVRANAKIDGRLLVGDVISSNPATDTTYLKGQLRLVNLGENTMDSLLHISSDGKSGASSLAVVADAFELIRGSGGSSSTTVNASGDVTIGHGLGTLSAGDYQVLVTVTGTTPYLVTVHSKETTPGQFKIRFFGATTGTALADTTPVTFDWQVRKTIAH